MLKVLKAELISTDLRLGVVHVRYHDLTLMCDICLYKNQKLWIRMPEVWLTKSYKKRFAYWHDPLKSEEFQKDVIEQIFAMTGLTLPMAIGMRKNFVEKKKLMTKRFKKNTLIKRTPRNQPWGYGPKE